MLPGFFLKDMRKFIRPVIGFSLFLAVAALYIFLPGTPPDPSKKITHIEVLKSARELQLYSNTELVKTYYVSLGKEPEGHKEEDGDGRTPEGKYTITEKISDSDHYKSLLLSYPDEEDIKIAAENEVELTDYIMIHGLTSQNKYLGRFHRWSDWTEGSIAVTNHEIDDIFNAVEVGTPVEIKE